MGEGLSKWKKKWKKNVLVAMVTWKICLFLVQPDSYPGRKITKTTNSFKLEICKININRSDYTMNQKKIEKEFPFQNGRHWHFTLRKRDFFDILMAQYGKIITFISNFNGLLHSTICDETLLKIWKKKLKGFLRYLCQEFEKSQLKLTVKRYKPLNKFLTRKK